MTIEEHIRQMKAVQPVLEQRIMRACRDATIRAVETAADMTPPVGELSGTHTRTGEMKQRWAADSVVVPVKKGGRIRTELNNDAEYASYVNDGHRLKRHFVPGLYVNPKSGLIEYDPKLAKPKKGKKVIGMMVGTKTHYVEGLHMTDEATKVYEETLRSELSDIGEIIKK